MAEAEANGRNVEKTSDIFTTVSSDSDDEFELALEEVDDEYFDVPDRPKEEQLAEGGSEHDTVKHAAGDEVEIHDVRSLEEEERLFRNAPKTYAVPYKMKNAQLGNTFRNTAIRICQPTNEWHCVVFHALIPTDIKFEPKTDKVFMHLCEESFPKQCLGEVVMHFIRVRQDANNAAEVVGYVNFKKFTSYEGDILYRYYIERNSKTSKGKERKPIVEDVYCKGKHGLRKIYASHLKSITGTIHLYDGFVYRKERLNNKEGMYQYFKKEVTRIISSDHKDADAKIVLEVFGKSIALCLFHTKSPASQAMTEAVDKSYCLMKCVEMNYLNYFKLFGQKHQVNTILWKVYTGLLNTKIGCTTERGIQEKMLISILMLRLQNLIKYSPDDPANVLLCRSFYPIGQAEVDTMCPEWNYLTKCFTDKDREIIKNAMVAIARDISKSHSGGKSPDWFYMIPAIHFLDGMYFETETTIHYNHNAPIQNWWGLEPSLVECADSFKKNTAELKAPLQDILEEMQPMFKYDYLLPRSIMGSLSLEETNNAIDMHVFPAEVCCASIFHYMKCSGKPEKIIRCLDSLIFFMEKDGNKMKQSDVVIGVHISVDVIKEVIKKKFVRLASKSVHVLLWFLANFDINSRQELAQDVANTFEKDVCDICKGACELVWDTKRLSTGETLIETFKIWDTLLAPQNMPNNCYVTKWIDMVAQNLTERIESRLKAPGSKFSSILVQAYCEQPDVYSRKLDCIIKRFVKQAVQNLDLLESLEKNEKIRKPLTKIVSEGFADQCEKFMKPHGGFELQMLLSWKTLPSILQKFGSENVEIETMYGEYVLQIRLKLEAYICLLKSRDIQIQDLRLIDNHLENFYALVDVLRMNEAIDKNVIELRVLELQRSKELLSELDSMRELCLTMEDVTVDLCPLDRLLKKNINTCTLSELVTVTDESNVHTFDKSKVFLVSEALNASVRNMIAHIHRFSKSTCFMEMWNEESRKLVNKSSVTLENVRHSVYEPVYQRLQEIEKQVLSGNITLDEMDNFIGRNYGDNLDEMANELATVFPKMENEIIRQRVAQFEQCKEIIAVAEIASEIIVIRNNYDLSGNFKPVERISTFDIRDVPLSSNKDDFLEASKTLKCLSHEKLLCLKSFSKSKALVTWLRDSMEIGGLRELNVFVDLAIMTAGDDAQKVSRVQSLHIGVTGYSSLIFELSEYDDYRQFLHKCEHVWQELQNAPELPEKLEYADRYLYWFKEIKQAHGAVEVTSFVQAEVINEAGIYKIGANVLNTSDRCDFYSSVAELTDIKQVLKLTVLVDKNQEVPKEYTYDKLQDLQSRLMLVVGEEEKSKNTVERFSLVYNAVIRLCNIYLKLVKSGCMLFQDFAIKVYCDISLGRPVCVTLEFENVRTQLKCQKSENEELEDVIHKIASRLETYLTDWLHYVDENRKQYPDLNYFTIEQLVILTRELAKVSYDDGPECLIYPLLYVVKKNCNFDDVRYAHKAAKKDDEMNTDLLHAKRPCDEFDDSEEAGSGASDTDTEARENAFVQALMSAGYERFVQFALKEFPDLNESDALCWCMENEDNIEEMEAAENLKSSMLVDSDVDIPVSSSTHDSVSIKWIISRAIDSESAFDRCEAMLSKLHEIWEDFLKSILGEMEGFISLKHLGVLLRHLASIDKHSFERKLPDGLSDHSPNLIVCKQDDIWCQILSLYLGDEQKPLPMSDEVLTCSESTPFEQVDIFLRRAFFNQRGRIHCLVNADKMDFIVCEKVEQRIQTFIREVGKNAKYHLVIMCGMDSEHKSILNSAMEKFRRGMVLTDRNRICKVLAKKLQNDDDRGNKVAPAVDFERSSVRVVKSTSCGSGKTLYKKRREEELKNLTNQSFSVSIPLQEKYININYVTGNLLPHMKRPESKEVKIIHIDITNEVCFGTDDLLFNLLILGCLVDKSGYVWRKDPNDLYLIETMETKTKLDSKRVLKETQVMNLFPDMMCRSPKECYEIYNGKRKCASCGYEQLIDTKMCKIDIYQTSYNRKKESNVSSSNVSAEGSENHCLCPEVCIYEQLFDSKEHESGMYKTSYQCLKEIDGLSPMGCSKDSRKHCLSLLLKHCGVSNPSWGELHHFVKFLYRQLLDFEKTDFVGEAAQQMLPGFDIFVKRFLLPMSRDFSSRSLNISEEPKDNGKETVDDQTLKRYSIKRTWESSPHPYLFFNADGHTFTFLGFHINNNGDLIDVESDTVIKQKIMSPGLFGALRSNNVPLTEDFDRQGRNIKIQRLCRVMGVTEHDESVYDQTYELTTDNCKKILAVYMRFRCDIPVIVMGETGCGKTRLVKFLCDLMVPRDEKTHKAKAQNMIIMKVHGGITNEDIKRKVKEAEFIAEKNMKNYSKTMFTVLFFDEANTTESVGLIKEILCDKSIEGKPINLCQNLKFVAACNPYRSHPDDVIQNLNNVGLGYHVSSNDTKDRFGNIPMRHLVYRVKPLPQSLMAFVWDFGQLRTPVEMLYIRQMVRRYAICPWNAREGYYGYIRYDQQEVISSVLTESQRYMRECKDECSFVSLRDVERSLRVMCWFYSKCHGKRTLFNLADKKLNELGYEKMLNDVTRSLILALGVCYHSSLTNRAKYRQVISKAFRSEQEKDIVDEKRIIDEIESIQEVFLENVKLEKNIAKNQALKENLFMMVVCIELRIPLFLVGKPGSSKSLAKVIVTDEMQGRAAKTELFKELKQVQSVSFQCSPLSTTDGILTTFRQGANFQERRNLGQFVSVVVLDEIGLAEDSPRMPLKVLHPLLEDGCAGDEIAEEYKKVAFIGLSNWSLDPAKMNRGIFVQMKVPNVAELEETASGICSKKSIFKPLAKGYLKVFEETSKRHREFFGLRDFYSLVKMMNMFISYKGGTQLTYNTLRFAVRRNFGGLETFDPFKIFLEEFKYLTEEERKPGDPCDSCFYLINSWLTGNLTAEIESESESRHLLLLTENYSAISIFEQKFLTSEKNKPVVLFGSSFRRDLEYTQVCRNINKIKLCMETGRLVILLNLNNLYESLYDALNQYYVYFGGERYVDLGLGTHRVKCPVHKKFKLIVIAGKDMVYKTFPVPLINRLEKQFFNSKSLMSSEQKFLAEQLNRWICKLTKEALTSREIGAAKCEPTDDDKKKIFIGYHYDTCAAVAMSKWTKEHSFDNAELWNEVYLEAKQVLLWCATPDALVRIKSDKDEMQDIYWNQQAHDSITDYLAYHFKGKRCSTFFGQVTTHSALLTSSHKHALAEATGIHPNEILFFETLSSFDTEQQFTSKIREHLRICEGRPSLLVIQCDSGDTNGNLITCAKYSTLDECSMCDTVSIVFIVQLTPMETKHFQSMQCGKWHSAHIDNLFNPIIEMPRLQDMEGKCMSALITDALASTDVEDESTHNIAKERKNCLDLKGLILRCLHRAMSMITDTDLDCRRPTERISWVLSVLQESSERDSKLFVKGVGVLIRDILEKDESNCQQLKNWLLEEAATTVAIQTFGTIRRACLQSFENKISPIISCIFAELDSNRNLETLHSDSSSWQRRLWLSLLNTTEVRKYMEESIRIGDNVIVVQGHGFNGQMFNCKMPFSWIVHQTFEKYIKQNEVNGDSFKEGTDSLTGILEGTMLGQVLDSLPKEFVRDALECYITDFVEIMYQERKDRHLVFLFLKYFALKDTNTTLTYAIVCVHRVYHEAVESLKYFREISNVWQDCNDTLLQNDGKALEDGNELTQIALFRMVDSISPASKEIGEIFDNRKGRDSWLLLVLRYREVVNKTLAFYAETGNNSERICQTRRLWNRIIVMQLFMENLCSRPEDQIFVNRCKPLWVHLSQTDTVDKKRIDVDFKRIDVIKRIEQFLKICLRTAKTQSEKKTQACKNCGLSLSANSKTLPCTDTICEKCIKEILQEEESAQKCPVCKKPVAKGWERKTADEEQMKMWIADKVSEYRQKCNSFLMDVVSQLCFANNTPPDTAVIDWLMSCYFQKSTIDIGIDLNEMFRTFLLKHLVRTDELELHRHLWKYIQTLTEDNVQLGKLKDVTLNIIYSIEDIYYENAALNDAPDISVARNCLEDALRFLRNEACVVDQIYGVARARLGLSVAAKYVDTLLFHSKHLDTVEKEAIFELMKIACKTCRKGTLPWKYFLRCITNGYGADVLLSAAKCADDNINWIKTSVTEEKIEEKVDMYTACGEQYISAKTLLTNAFISESNKNALIEYIEQSKSANDGSITAVMIELALYRFVKVEGKNMPFALEQFMIEINKAFARMCLSVSVDHFDDIPLQIQETDIDRVVNIKCLIFHWMSVLKQLRKFRITTMAPLLQLVTQPNGAKDLYLPCMPSDVFYEKRQEIMNTVRDMSSGEKIKFYQCEIGHPYAVGDCGRPVESSTCICGRPIGGTGYNKLHFKNRLWMQVDGTKRGYCLGDPKDREPGAIPHRSLTDVECAVLKLLLHLTMFIGCNGKLKQDVLAMIQPPISENDVHTFLWDHLQLDIEDLQCCMALNVTDVLLLLHVLVDSIHKKSISGEPLLQKDVPKWTFWVFLKGEETIPSELSTKRGRDIWERKFADDFLKEISQIENRRLLLQKANGHLQKSNNLFAMLEENTDENVEEKEKPKGFTHFHKTAQFWIYRVPISLKRMDQAFRRLLREDASTYKSYPVLTYFLEKLKVLSAVRFVPRILQLQKALLRRYNRKIFKSEAEEIAVAQLRKERIAGDDTDSLLDDVIEAWNLTRTSLQNYNIKTASGGTVLYNELSRDMVGIPISDRTPIVYLLPTMHGDGICTYSMLDLLIRCHNDVIERSGNRQYGPAGFSTVLPKHITSAHVTCFRPHHDILPIVLANCSLSSKHVLEDDYDFQKIEKCIVERFVSTKSKVVIDNYLQVDLMIYRSDLTPASKLDNLDGKIKQESLVTVVKSVLCDEVNQVPVISQILSKLDVAINFLNITGGSKEDFLYEFMVDRLKMNRNVLTPQMQQECRLKHVKSLWLTLSIHKAFIMVQQNKPTTMIFENIAPGYHRPLPNEPEEHFGVEKYLELLSKDRLLQLLEITYEFIMNYLTQEGSNEGRFSAIGNCSLKDALIEAAFTDEIETNLRDIPDFVLCIHSLHFWMAVSSFYERRRKDKTHLQ